MSTLKKTVFVAKNKLTGNYLGVDESGEQFDIDPNTSPIGFVSNLFWSALPDESFARSHIEDYYSGYELIKAQITLTIKEIT